MLEYIVLRSVPGSVVSCSSPRCIINVSRNGRSRRESLKILLMENIPITNFALFMTYIATIKLVRLTVGSCWSVLCALIWRVAYRGTMYHGIAYSV